MNGLSAPQPPVGVPLVTHVNAAGGAPRISPALLRGAMELTAIFEQRTAKIRADYEESIAKLRADYEEKIRVLTQERDAASAQASDLPQHGHGALDAELAKLRVELDTWRTQCEKERAERVLERAQWEKERAQWEKERAQWEKERAQWEKERAQERTQWEQERERWRQDGTEQLMKWEQEKNAIAKERAIHQALEQQVDALQKEKTELQETNKTLLAQIAQLQSTDAHHSDTEAIGVFPPPSSARSATLATLASFSTLSTLKSPSQEPVPMEVRSTSLPLLPLPFDDFLINLSPASDLFLEPPLGPQIDPPLDPSLTPLAPSPSSQGPRQGPSQSPRRADDVPQAGPSRAAVGASQPGWTAPARRKSPKWKFFIRIPPSNEPPPRQIKPPLTPPPSGKILEVIRWPRQPASDDEKDGDNDRASGTEAS